MPTQTSEQRRAERFPIECPVEFEQGTGMSRNISTTGIYIITECLLNLRDKVRLVIRFPHMPSVGCHGHIVRVETEAKGYGVAVYFTDFSFGPGLGAL